MKHKWFWLTVLVGMSAGLLATPLLVTPVIGIETSYPSACPDGSWGHFVGGERGHINGFWSAQVCHTQLSIYKSARVLPGGDLHLNHLGSGGRGAGHFVSGVIGVGSEHDWQAGGVGGCLQVYQIWGLRTASGLAFDATLTHYGVFYGGRCHIFFAVLAGNDKTAPASS